MEALIFDMDRVLIDSELVSKQAFVQVFSAVNIPFSEDMYQKLLGRSLKDSQHFLAKYYQDA